MNEAVLKEAHKLCSEHEDLIKELTQVGCFYCGKIFFPTEIKEWLPLNPDNKCYKGRKRTALCPHCRIDTCLPANCGFEITPEFLDQMDHYWFKELYDLKIR